jgi:hypothetical protein
MDSKVEDYERAAYWKGKGYNFDPRTTMAFQMDSKVEDYERAAYWKQQGYNFDPRTTMAFQMDAKVAEGRAALKALPVEEGEVLAVDERREPPKAVLVDIDSERSAADPRPLPSDNRPTSTAPSNYRSSPGLTYTRPATASYTPSAASSYTAPRTGSSSPVASTTYTRESSPSYTRRATPTYAGSSSSSRYTDYNYRPAVGDHYVQGHLRSDGTYVDGHHRTNHDDSFWNNYSSLGNVNHYTGSTGTKVPSYRYSGGGSSYVRGYFRSNGTYVSGHTRRSR